MAKSKYTDEFKMKVAEAATEEDATLKSVGEKFGVNPTLVRNWKIQFASTSGSGIGNGETKMVDFVINETVCDNDDVMDQITSIEDKILERGLITEYCPTGDFDFSTNFYTANDKHYLGIDLFSDNPNWSLEEVEWESIAGYIIAKFEERGIFGDVAEALGDDELDTEKVICVSNNDFVKFIDFV
jgi:hypothetical protein